MRRRPVQAVVGAVRPLRYDSPAVKGSGEVVAGVVDVDDPERAWRERALALEDTVADMFQRNSAVKLLIDPAGGSIVDANEAAAEFYGYSRDELTRMTIMDLNQLPMELVEREMERARS